VRELSVAQMQLVEIAKALTLRSRILLLDEPTASITPHETAVLFGLLRRLRDEGVAIVFVSHKLEELYEIADRVTVLRDGRNACVAEPMRSLAHADLVRLMIGRDEQVTAVEAAARPGAPALELRQVATSVGHADLSFTLHEGEILGLYGLVGAGRSELAKALVGVDRVTAGEIRVNGRPAAIASPTDALHRNGIGYVSEDRKSEGLILMHSVQRNICTTVWGRIAGLLGTLTGRAERGRALPLIRALDIRTPSPAQTVGNLSGGNQQKVSIAKWLAAEARILIVDEPTVGIDIRTKANLHGLIRAMAREGKAVLLITSDMPEMIELADRICVMAGFRIVGELANSRDYDGMSARIMALIQASEDVEGPPAPASAFAPAQ
jgi:ribose transport system ATP-binding protein